MGFITRKKVLVTGIEIIYFALKNIDCLSKLEKSSKVLN
jgi:hypothetical protein